LRTPSRLVLFLVGLTVGAVSIAPTAQATGRVEASASFSVPGSNGFALDVSSQGGEVTVIASERQPPVATFGPDGRPRPAAPVNGASSVYTASTESAGPGVVDVGLGEIGSIAVRFRPSGRVRVSDLGRVCGRHLRIVRRLGTFTGTISFRGEGGYTSVAATSARGSVGTPMPAACKRGEAPGSPSRPLFRRGRGASPAPSGTALLTAFDPGSGSGFRAATGPGGVRFRARVEERTAGGVTVVRRAYAGAPADAFAFNSALTRAVVRPPAPFAGDARFETKSAGVVWRGSLRVTFPGLSVAMAGPGFRPSLERPR
jgi:hypothetical protein